MPYLERSDGAKIHYLEAGSGRPLVMLHGWAGSGSMWRYQMELADLCRLVVPDLRGHGLSTAPSSDLRLDDMADDLVALFEALDLRDAILVGWSLGSQVVITSFPRLKERVARLVLVGATPRFTSCEGYPHGLPEQELRGMGLRLRRNHQRTLGEFFQGMFVPGELTGEQEARMATDLLSGSRLPAPEIALSALTILATADLRPALGQIDRPVLVIHGKEDPVCPPGAARYLAEELPDARLLEMGGVGHAPGLSRPEEFNEILRVSLRKANHG